MFNADLEGSKQVKGLDFHIYIYIYVSDVRTKFRVDRHTQF
jgi:hypothetical protein